MARNCWQYAVLAFATARAAVVLVPINFMLTAEEIAYILGHSQVRGVIVEHDLIPTAAQAMTRGGTVTTKVVLTTGEQRAPAGWDTFPLWLTTTTPAPDPEIDDDQLLRLMYTSGTESRPKGVMHSSRSLMANYVSSIVAGSMESDDVEIHSLPLYHCAQLDNFLATDVYLGATSIILPRPDPELVLRGIEAHSVTNYFAPPTSYRTFTVAHFRPGRLEQPAQGVLRLIGNADGSAARDPRPASESCSSGISTGRPEMAPLASAMGPDDQRDHAGAAGRPAINVETAIVDDTDHPVRPGMVGEIAHRGPHLMLGYLDDPVPHGRGIPRWMVPLR